MTIAEEIQAIRKAQGLSLRQVADKCGLTYTHIGKIERGETSPTVDVMNKLLSAYGKELTIVDAQQSNIAH